MERDDLVGLLAGQVDAPLRAAEPKGRQRFVDPEKFAVKQDIDVGGLVDHVRMPAVPPAGPVQDLTPEKHTGGFAEDVGPRYDGVAYRHPPGHATRQSVQTSASLDDAAARVEDVALGSHQNH